KSWRVQKKKLRRSAKLKKEKKRVDVANGYFKHELNTDTYFQVMWMC
ncbi:hypothetical protein CEXT_192181, partial [Caerostris extrusa]